ncbi:hypothetical protein PMAYCL1PPCAC_14690 [Pristionchus mayeri]|uniref:Dpy-30 n=1 Tax=Pristionchus mayeri TaxID=1317129 RepID=A0AAN5CFM9_9BILA|nr:hypothetical protein PMAYCL1PPCAC_14690 [Pristionchus mayeri]
MDVDPAPAAAPTPVEDAPAAAAAPAAPTEPQDTQTQDAAASGGAFAALAGMPTRQYLDTTVVPILLQGLGAIAKERPADPIEFLANFLKSEKGKYETPASN